MLVLYSVVSVIVTLRQLQFVEHDSERNHWSSVLLIIQPDMYCTSSRTCAEGSVPGQITRLAFNVGYTMLYRI